MAILSSWEHPKQFKDQQQHASSLILGNPDSQIVELPLRLLRIVSDFSRFLRKRLFSLEKHLVSDSLILQEMFQRNKSGKHEPP